MRMLGEFNPPPRGVIALLLVMASVAGCSIPFVYRGDHVYVVPEAMADKMTEFAPQESWQFFPELRRYVDSDDDGSLDFVAVALGAEGGFGAQIRYRLSEVDESGEQALGNWYWCVITDETGEKVFEQFNP